VNEVKTVLIFGIKDDEKLLAPSFCLHLARVRLNTLFDFPKNKLILGFDSHALRKTVN
jgi:hypothetical protein